MCPESLSVDKEEELTCSLGPICLASLEALETNKEVWF